MNGSAIAASKLRQPITRNSLGVNESGAATISATPRITRTPIATNIPKLESIVPSTMPRRRVGVTIPQQEAARIKNPKMATIALAILTKC